MKKPIIGITLDNEEPGSYSKFPWYAIRQNYLHSIDRLGGIPFPIFHSQKNIKEIFNMIDGLIITGGNFDIDPKIYGEKSKKSRLNKNKRTSFEMAICKLLLDSDKPILGICGGEQLINIACSGTLIQDIFSHNPRAINHEQPNPRDETSHSVKIHKKTKLSSIIKKNIIKVNSAHHQSVDKIGKDLIVTGKAKDGIVESIEHIKHFWCIGVQWHPEFLITLEDKLLLKDFVKQSNKK